MARDAPDGAPDAPASSSSLPRQQHLTSAVQPPGSLPGTQDLAAGFLYARAPPPVPLGGGSRSHRQDGNGNDQEGETEDEPDRVVLAGMPSSAPASRLPQRPAAPAPFASQPASSALDQYRLNPSGAGSPPRAPLFHRAAAAPGGQAQTSFASNAPKPFIPTGTSHGQQQGAHPLAPASASAGVDSAAQQSGTGQPVPFAAPGPHATQHQQQAKQQKSDLPASTAPAASIAVAAAANINPKKRIRSNESTGTTGTPPAASGSGRVKSAGEGGGATGGKGGGGGAGRNLAAQGGEQGAVAPAGKRRKAETGGGVADVDVIISTATKLSVERQAKDDEIRHLRQQLSEKTVEAQRLFADKERIKGEFLAKVRAALVKTGEAHDNLKTTASEVRSGLASLKAEVTGGTTAENVRVELESLKTTFSNQFLNDSHELWLERNEETKVAHLKDLCAQIEKRDDTIQLLRSQLDNRLGELAEAKDKVTELDNLLTAAKGGHASLEADLGAVRQAAATEKSELTARLHDALVDGVTREEQQQAKLREVADEWARKLEDAGKREEVLREKWTEAKQGAAEKEDELRREMATAREAAEAEAKRKEGELRDELDKGTRALRAKERDYEEVEARLRKLEKEQQNAVRSAEAVAAELRQTRTNLAQAEQIERDTEKRKTASVEAERDTEKRQTASLKAEREQHEQAEKALKAKLAQTEMQLAATSEANKSKAVEIEEFKSKNARELDEASNTLSLLHQQQHSPSPDADVVAQAQEVVRLRAQIDEFKHTISQLTLDKASATAAREHAEEAVRSLNSEQQRLTVERNRFSELASRWEAELLAAQTSLAKHAELVQTLEGRLESAQNAEATFTAKLKEAEVRFAEEKKAAVSKAVESCRDASSREMMQKSNELKRAKNALHDLEKRLNKTQNDLAKTKNDRPVLNEKITSSDSGGDASRFPPAGNSNGRIDSITAVAPYAASGPVRSPSSDLTAVEDLEGSLDLESPKSKAKSVKFADGADHPQKTKRRPSLTSTTSKPLKKTDSKTKRRASEIDDDYYRDPSEKSGFDSLVVEDEIVESSPVPPQKPRPLAKTTYGTKKRR
ncbi:hypothetical protein JCM10213v2_003051 [Rhodosporidiobolus nylandii]